MARLNIVRAAKAAGVSRQTLYSNYIKSGKITVETDEQGAKYIDTTEIIRVFGSLQPDSLDSVNKCGNGHKATPDLDSKIKGLELEVKLVREQLQKSEERGHPEVQLLREQLQKSEEREQRLLVQVDKLTDTIKQIEHKQPEQALEPVRRSWLSRFFGRA